MVLFKLINYLFIIIRNHHYIVLNKMELNINVIHFYNKLFNKKLIRMDIYNDLILKYYKKKSTFQKIKNKHLI